MRTAELYDKIDGLKYSHNPQKKIRNKKRRKKPREVVAWGRKVRRPRLVSKEA